MDIITKHATSRKEQTGRLEFGSRPGCRTQGSNQSNGVCRGRRRPKVWLVIWPSLSIRLKLTTREAGLANDRLQSADANLVMVGDGNGYSTLRNCLLHYDVATAATNFFETRFSQNSANLLAGQEAQFNQPLPPPG